MTPELEIRWAQVDDAQGVAIVHIDSWRAAYRGLIDQGILDSLRVDERAAGWTRWIETSFSPHADPASPAPHRLLVAEAGGRIVGWASFGPGRDAGLSHLGELAGLYVHPEQWSSGMGHALLVRVEQELRAAQFMNVYLWALRGNERATRFYERHGWNPDGHEKIGDVGGTTGVHEVRHSRLLP